MFYLERNQRVLQYAQHGLVLNTAKLTGQELLNADKVEIVEDIREKLLAQATLEDLKKTQYVFWSRFVCVNAFRVVVRRTCVIFVNNIATAQYCWHAMPLYFHQEFCIDV